MKIMMMTRTMTNKVTGHVPDPCGLFICAVAQVMLIKSATAGEVNESGQCRGGVVATTSLKVGVLIEERLHVECSRAPEWVCINKWFIE